VHWAVVNMGHNYLLRSLFIIPCFTLVVIASDADVTHTADLDLTKDIATDASKLSVIKSDLQTAETGIGGIGYGGQGGGFGGGYNQGGGFGGGHGEQEGFGGAKKVGTGSE